MGNAQSLLWIDPIIYQNPENSKVNNTKEGINIQY